jgi:D-sedoheptulose 7-phosphate isomerase
MLAQIKKHLRDSIAVKEKILVDAGLLAAVEKVATAIVNAYKQGKKVILFGNGGSAADAQHIAGEFVGRFYKERKPLPALALHANTSIVTAIGNDYGYDAVFARQVEAHAVAGDVVIGISTSGNSPNVVTAIQKAKEKGAFTVGLTGGKESKLSQVADVCLRVPSQDTPRIQESHITLGHIICYLVEETLFPG